MKKDTMNTKETYNLTMLTNKAAAKERLEEVKRSGENSEDQVILEVLSIEENNGSTEVKVSLESSLPDPFPFFDLTLHSLSPVMDSVQKVD